MKKAIFILNIYSKWFQTLGEYINLYEDAGLFELGLTCKFCVIGSKSDDATELDWISIET